MITPVFSIDASLDTYPAKIFNHRELSTILWVRIPSHLRHLVVYDVVDAAGNSIPWERNGSEQWIQLSISHLNVSVGCHQYQIELIDSVSDWTTRIYFSYIVQWDNPDKPYYYMGDEREEE